MNPFSFLNPWVLLGLLSAFVGMGAVSYHEGGKRADDRHAAAALVAERKAQAEALERHKRIEADQRGTSDRIAGLETSLLTAQNTIRANQERIKREIPAHVTAKADAACTVPAGFVELWNGPSSAETKAGPPAVPADAASDVDRPSGVALSTIAEVNADNHAAYDSCRQTLNAARQWGFETQHWYDSVKGNNQ